MTGKNNFKLKYYKSLRATIATMFVNKKISEYIQFFHSQHETLDKFILRGIL